MGIMNPSSLIYGLWVLLVIYLTVTAFGVKRDTQPHLGQSFALLFALLAAFALPHVPFLHFVNLAPVGFALDLLGLILCLAGMVVLIWGRQSLGRNWSQTVAAKTDPVLVTSGPYRFVRHPMYAGGLLAAIGSALVVGGPFIFLLLLLGGIFLSRVGAEDRLMERQFPHEFPAYERRTKALIPFIW
jgi:protein-S-isoprenylcysteine O-methyltransferase Ste14